MKKLSYIAIGLFITINCHSQQKELNKLFKEACDIVDTPYVILKTGEKKNINSIQFTTEVIGARGKIILANGGKMKFLDDEITACYTHEATYKICSFSRSASNTGSGVNSRPRSLYGRTLAARKNKGPINIYYVRVVYSYRAEYGVSRGSDVIYYVENGNDGNLIELKDDTVVVNKVAGMVANSKRAMDLISKLRKTYGKWKAIGTIEYGLLEIAEVYNSEADKGKLQE